MRFLITFARIVAVFLIGHAVLFAVLQAFLFALLLLVAGVAILWATNRPMMAPKFANRRTASTRSSYKSIKNPYSVYLSGRYSAGDCYFEPNDQNPRSPQFRSLSEQLGNDVRDYNRD